MGRDPLGRQATMGKAEEYWRRRLIDKLDGWMEKKPTHNLTYPHILLACLAMNPFNAGNVWLISPLKKNASVGVTRTDSFSAGEKERERERRGGGGGEGETQKTGQWRPPPLRKKMKCAYAT